MDPPSVARRGAPLSPLSGHPHPGGGGGGDALAPTATVTRAAVQKLLKDHRGVGGGLAPLVRRDSLENLGSALADDDDKKARTRPRDPRVDGAHAARSRSALRLYFDARKARSAE